MADGKILNDQQRLINIFHPYAMNEVRKSKENNTRFVHYTTAEAAMNILKTQSVWMRNISCMNDYMEVRQGLRCLSEAYSGQAGEQIGVALNGIFAYLDVKTKDLFNRWAPNFESATYIACLSEHLDAEDAHGRLSMWRAYSESTGVALVLNNSPFLADVAPLHIWSSPVAYFDVKQVEQELRRVAERIDENADFLRAQNQDIVLGAMFNTLKLAALCIKHPGFVEEREWRVIYMPAIENSSYMKESIEPVGGAPQLIYKIPLKNLPDVGLSGIEVPELLNRIIIGPTKYPAAMHNAFTMLLSEVGVEDPAGRVHISDIPLRI